MLECLTRTEIAVHDGNNRVASLMHYEGDTINRITIGRNMGFAIGSIALNGNVGINNASPWAHLNLGNVNVGGSSG